MFNFVTPDSERTMCTFLGTAGKINENDVNINAIKKGNNISEGYLWDEENPKKRSIKQLIAHKKLQCLYLINFALIDIRFIFRSCKK